MHRRMSCRWVRARAGIEQVGVSRSRNWAGGAQLVPEHEEGEVHPAICKHLILLGSPRTRVGRASTRRSVPILPKACRHSLKCLS